MQKIYLQYVEECLSGRIFDSLTVCLSYMSQSNSIIPVLLEGSADLVSSSTLSKALTTLQLLADTVCAPRFSSMLRRYRREPLEASTISSEGKIIALIGFHVRQQANKWLLNS
jgi:hypothetical protein